ncbi:unnamed protein product [Natator depressus]
MCPGALGPGNARDREWGWQKNGLVGKDRESLPCRVLPGRMPRSQHEGTREERQVQCYTRALSWRGFLPGMCFLLTESSAGKSPSKAECKGSQPPEDWRSRAVPPPPYPGVPGLGIGVSSSSR